MDQRDIIERVKEKGDKGEIRKAAWAEPHAGAASQRGSVPGSERPRTQKQENSSNEQEDTTMKKLDWNTIFAGVIALVAILSAMKAFDINDRLTTLENGQKEVKGQIADLKTDVRGQITDLKTDVKGQISEIKGQITDMQKPDSTLMRSIKLAVIEAQQEHKPNK